MGGEVVPGGDRAGRGAIGRRRVLVVDDEKLIRWSLVQRLAAIGCEVLEAGTGTQAVDLFEKGVDLVLLDYRLPDVEGFSLLDRMLARDPDVPIIVLTAHSSVEGAVTAMRRGAYDYAAKPFDLTAVAMLVERALEATRLRREVRALRASASTAPALDGLIGRSPAIREAKELVKRIAESPASTVLITGESGTGKSLIARAIHAESDRRDAPFLNITCSALPATLLESELFGHERGAFTDAKERKAGLLQHADHGTVFLDEIGEMDPSLQAKLLRFLEEKTFRRVGGTVDISTDVRVVAATNADLREAVRDGRLREDLYYRLAVLTIHVPPLRERQEDIEFLAMYFVEFFNREFHRDIASVHPDAMETLRVHPWPGNVRELKNAVERAVLLAARDTLTVEDLGLLGATAVDHDTIRLPAGGIDVRELEKSLVCQALERTRGNQTRAAALLGMNRDQIRYRIASYGLRSYKPEKKGE